MTATALDCFTAVWLVDFEFHCPPGERPTSICMVAREFRSGQTIRFWQNDLASAETPYPLGPDSLFVAYYASAELGCHLALDWPIPARILDLCAEFKCLTSGLAPTSTPAGRGLLGALAYHGIDCLGVADKRSMQDLAIRGGPFTEQERQDLLAYCESDVVALAKLLPAMLPKIDLPRALLRGRYMAAAAKIEANGVPIDAHSLDVLRNHWTAIQGRLVAKIDREYGCYVPTGRTIDPNTPLGSALIDVAAADGIDPYLLADTVDKVWATERQARAEVDEARRIARKTTGLTIGRLNRWEDAGCDHTTWPGLDDTARSLAFELPALGIGHGFEPGTGRDRTDYAGQLWGLLRQIDQSPIKKTDPAMLRRAAELVAVAGSVVKGRKLSFSSTRFAAWLVAHGIPWPRRDDGNLALDDEIFRQMSRAYPCVAPLRELRHSLSELRLNELAVGSDGRNRCLLSAFGSKTGRNQPSNSKFIFGPSVWLRNLIQPPPGWAVAYIDWTQQEVGIAAALSHDPVLIAAYKSGDVYLAFAKQAGAVPADATKKSHPDERELFKQCVLAVQYLMGERSLAQRIGKSEAHARELLRLHHQTYPVFWRWSQAAVDHAMLRGWLQTVFGWRVHVGHDANPRSLANFPMQANGAEMLRLACCLATERGIRVCAPVHDALLIEAAADDIEQAVADCQAAMAEASEIVLGGFRLRSDVKIVRHPDRYSDPRGEKMWSVVQGILVELREIPH